MLLVGNALNVIMFTTGNISVSISIKTSLAGHLCREHPRREHPRWECSPPGTCFLVLSNILRTPAVAVFDHFDMEHPVALSTVHQHMEKLMSVIGGEVIRKMVHDRTV